MKKRLLPLILLLMTASFSYAQSAAKNLRMVYLWDVTYSMHGGYFAPAVQTGTVTIAGTSHIIKGYSKSDDIYDKILEALISDIEKQGENTEIVVIPFGQKVLGCWTEMATQEGKMSLIDNIRNFCNLESADVQGTSISGALEYARNNVFVADVPNVLKLLTDGRENNNTRKFYYILDNWCEFAAERNIASYYFVLSSEVLKNASDLKDRLEKSCFTVITKFDTDVELQIEKTYLSISPEEIDIEVQEDYGKPIVFHVNMNSSKEKSAYIRFKMDENPYFVLDKTVEVSSGVGEISLKPQCLLEEAELRRQLPVENPMKLSINFSLAKEDESIELQSDKCILSFINKKLKKVTISVQ